MRLATSASEMPSPSWRARSSSAASRDHLAEDLLLQAERAGLVGRDRTAELLAEALQTLVVLVAELVDRNLGLADLGHGENAEAAENVADAPDAEADHQEQHHRRHDDAAEPVGGGLS